MLAYADLCDLVNHRIRRTPLNFEWQQILCHMPIIGFKPSMHGQQVGVFLMCCPVPVALSYITKKLVILKICV